MPSFSLSRKLYIIIILNKFYFAACPSSASQYEEILKGTKYMYIVFLILLIAFLIVEGILSINDVKKLKDTVISENIRVKLYRESIIWQWAPIVCILLIYAFSYVSFQDIGLGWIYLWGPLWFRIIIFVLCGGFLALLLYQIFAYIVSAKFREQAKEKFASNESSKNHYDAVMANVMIPRTKKEKTWFLFLTASAGICEETVWRGFLFFLLQTVFPSWSIIIVVAVASLVFGVGHLYQGPAGFAKTSLFGALFGCLYVATGSLLPGMLLHFVADYSSAFILSEDLSEDICCK